MVGGARSGKSAFAESLAQSLGGDRVLYVATAIVRDDRDLERRVRRHRERRPPGWGTLELGGGDLGEVSRAGSDWSAGLFDSLTLWVSARLSSGDEEGEILDSLDAFLGRAEAAELQIVVVSDEAGMGVVPGSEPGRRFRDLLGLANQRVAAAAQEVHLCVAGIPLRVK